MKWYQPSAEMAIRAIAEDKIATAFFHLKEAIEYFDDVFPYNQHFEDLESYFSSFANEGANNGEKDLNKDYHMILDELYTLGCQLEIFVRNTKDSTFIALSRRGMTVKDDNIEEKIGSYLAEEAMLNLKHQLSPEELAEKSNEIQKQLNDYRNRVFSHLTSIGMLNKEQQQSIENLLLSPIVDEHSECLFVTAITLACLTIFDKAKCDILFNCYFKSKSLTVKARALVGVALCLAVMPRFMVGERSHQWLKQALEKVPSFKKDIEGAQMQLSLSKLSITKQVGLSKVLFKDIITALDIESEEQRTERIIGNNGEENWDNSEENPINLEDNGYDIYIGQFQTLKGGAFFHTLCNWFMPFEANHPFVYETLKKRPKGRETLQTLRNQTHMTDCDIYGLLDLFKKHPKMLDSLLTMYEDEGSSRIKHKINTLVEYVRTLYRFFYYSPMADSFFNPFTEKLPNGNLGYCFLSTDFYKEQEFKEVKERVITFSFDKADAHLTASLLDFLDADTFEYHLMKGISLGSMPDVANPEEVYYHLSRAHEMNPDHQKALAALTAFCYQPQYYEKFIEHSQQAIEMLRGDEEDTFYFKKDMIHAYIELGRIEDALKICYELNYKHPDDESVRLFLTHCLLRRKVEDIMQQVDKVEAMIDENLDNGYTAFMRRQLKKSKEQDSPEELLKGIFSILENSDEHRPIVEQYNLYNKALCLLAHRKRTQALETLTKCLAITAPSGKNKFVDFILRDATKWLALFGYTKEEVLMIVQISLYRDTQRLKKHNKHAGK